MYILYKWSYSGFSSDCINLLPFTNEQESEGFKISQKQD